MLTTRQSPTVWRNSQTGWRNFNTHAQQHYARSGYYEEMNFFRAEDVHMARIEALTFRENYMGEGIIYERDGKTVRSIFGIQDSNHRLVDILCTDALIALAMTVLDSEVYIHQFHVNYKQAWVGGGYDLLALGGRHAAPSVRVDGRASGALQVRERRSVRPWWLAYVLRAQ